MKSYKLMMVIFWTLFILYEGSRPLDVSLNQSNKIVNWSVEQIESYQESTKYMNHLIKDDDVQLDKHVLKTDFYHQMSLFIRKSAHFIEYFILASLFSRWLKTKSLKWIEMIIYPLFFVLVIAVGDEFIQSFVGRGSNVRDVLIDFSGGILAVIILQGIRYKNEGRIKFI